MALGWRHLKFRNDLSSCVWARLAAARRCAGGVGSDTEPARILEWIAQPGIATALSDPGKPWQNGIDESFNGELRDECLSLEWFRSRREAPALHPAQHAELAE